MPDRVVRSNILTSDAVNALSWPAEIFYRRLMSIVDDFGRCDGRTSILRSSLYPLKLDKVSEPDIVKWLGECSNTGLVRCYHVDGKEYLEIQKFQQRLRQMKSRYPPPADNCQQLTADCGQLSPETETKQKLKTEEKPPPVFNSELLVPQMQQEFKNLNPDGFFDQETDFPALREIGGKIKKWKGLQGEMIENKEKIIQAWRELLTHIKADGHLSKYSIQQINKHFGSIVQSYTNSQKATIIQITTNHREEKGRSILDKMNL